jgi:hypothetical protein
VPTFTDSRTGTITLAGGFGVVGISVAFGQTPLSTAPGWTRIDNPLGISVVNGFTLRRGRSYLTDKIDGGTASVSFVDVHGVMDPTNTSGPLYPMNPNAPAAIAIQNLVTGNWVTLFTGLIQGVPQQVNVDSAANRGSLELADLFSLLAIKEVPAGLTYTDAGDSTYTSASNTSGNTVYPEQTVQDRIKAILADAAVPAALTNIYSGNVRVQVTTYSPGEKILSALQDAADAEFPGVANLFVGKDGVVNFRGRLARFNPSAYGITSWDAADTAGLVSHTSRAVLQSITLDRDVNKIVNNALFAPQGVADTAIAGQLVSDATSITNYGPRGLTGMDLINAGATTGTLAGDPLGETKLFSTFYDTNMKDPATRVQQATFRWVPASHPNAAYHWNFLCNVEIDDIVNITTTHPGGGGFSASPYFVEGISYDAALGPTNQWDLTLTLDLSPAAYYTTQPTNWAST